MNQSLVHADAFFLITTIAVALIAAAVVVLLIYVSLILKNVHRIIKRVQQETDLVADDLGELRKSLKNESKKLKPIVTFITKTANRFVKGTKSK